MTLRDPLFAGERLLRLLTDTGYGGGVIPPRLDEIPLPRRNPLDYGMEERNKICLQSNPPKCFYEDELYKDPLDPHPFNGSKGIGGLDAAFDVSIENSSPYKEPSQKDYAKDDILNSPGYKHLLEKGLIPRPKADASDSLNEGIKDLEAEYLVPDYLKQKLREMEWKERLKKRRMLGLEPTV